jgi:hypothetical protein
MDEDPGLAAKIHEEGWGSDPAQFLATHVDPAKRGQVVERAQELAQQEANSKQAGAEGGTAVPEGGTGTSKKKKATPQKKHLQQAAVEAEALTKTEPVNRKGLLEFFTDIMDSPAYGHENSPVRSFARYFVDKFATGNGTHSTLFSKFDKCVMDEESKLYSGEGTPSKAEQTALAEEEERAKARDAKKAGKGKGKEAEPKAEPKAEPEGKGKGGGKTKAAGK